MPYSEALNNLISAAATCKRRNTPEWMAYFAGCINDALAANGDDSRVEYPGKWSNEFHLVLGSPIEEPVPVKEQP